MIKGNPRREEYIPDYDEDQEREMWFDHTLDQFEGVPGHLYGVMDELHDLAKLVETMGNTVVKEEQEFRVIEKEEYEPEINVLSDRLLRVWHKKMYRQFTYKSMLMLIHATFENGMVRLYEILVAEKRITDTVNKRAIVDILKDLQPLDTGLPPLYDQVRAFNFVRNKAAHAEGYYQDPSRDIDAFKNLVAGRDDIAVTKLIHPKGRFTHQMQINRSSVLTDYLDVIRKVFEGILKGAKKLEYVPVPAS